MGIFVRAVEFVVILTLAIVGDGASSYITIGVITATQRSVKTVMFPIGHVIVRVEWHVTDTEDLYRLFMKVHQLDEDSSIDAIIVLGTSYYVYEFKDTFLKTRLTPIVLWGELSRTKHQIPSPVNNKSFVPRNSVCPSPEIYFNNQCNVVNDRTQHSPSRTTAPTTVHGSPLRTTLSPGTSDISSSTRIFSSSLGTTIVISQRTTASPQQTNHGRSNFSHDETPKSTLSSFETGSGPSGMPGGESVPPREKAEINVSVSKTLFDGPTLLSQLAEYLHWKRVTVVYDSATAQEAGRLQNALSRRDILFVLYNSQMDTSPLDTPPLGASPLPLQEMYSSAERLQTGLNFIVLGRQDSVMAVMKQANDFDSMKNDNKTTLKSLSRWLVGIYGNTSLSSLQPCANDLDNVVTVHIPEVVLNQQSALSGFLLKTLTLLDLAMSDQELELLPGCPVYLNTTADILHCLLVYIAQASPTMNGNKLCDVYRIDTLHWTRRGRQFGTVGYVLPSGDVVIQHDLFPNTKYGFNKRQLIVTMVEYPPFIIRTNRSGHVRYEGFCIDILDELASIFNFTYRITNPPDGNYGTLEDRETMRFNGMIGQLQRKEVDMAVGDIAIQRDRETVMDFMFPYHYEYSTVLLRKPHIDQNKWKKLLEPLKVEVVLAVGACLLAGSLAVYFLERVNPFYRHKAEGASVPPYMSIHSYMQAFQLLYAFLLNEGHQQHLPKSTTGRTFIACWAMFCLVIIATYSGNLIASITVTKPRLPFGTLKEMAELEGEYTWGLIGGTMWEQIFMTSPLPEFHAVGEAIGRFHKSDPSVLEKDSTRQRYRVATSYNYAFISDVTSTEIAMATNCELTRIKEKFIPYSVAFGLPDRSPHVQAFSKQIVAAHESGLMEIWRRRWLHASPRCNSDTTIQVKPIALLDVQSAFYLAMGGIVLGTIALITEVTIGRCRRRNESCGNRSGS